MSVEHSGSLGDMPLPHSYDELKKFEKMPFPMFLFVPPQKKEYMELMKKSPHIINWWTSKGR